MKIGILLIPRSILLGLLLISGGCAYTEELPSEKIVEEKTKPKTHEPAPVQYHSMIAERHQTVYSVSGETKRYKTTVFRDGMKVRHESSGSSQGRVSIIDYDALKEFRLFETDRIFFHIDISNRTRLRAEREGLIPLKPVLDIEIERYVLGKMELENHPCEIILMVRRKKFERNGIKLAVVDYTLIWEALDLKRQPLRVAYNQTHDIIIVVDYRNVQTTEVDPSLLRVPEGYLSMSRF